jgi:hypothetical protein
MTLPRSVKIKLTVFGYDDETLSSGDTKLESKDFVFPINDRQVIIAPKYVMGWGGECRVEISYNLQVLEDDITIRLFGEALLFEGTSESTEELNGRVSFDNTVGSTRDLPFRRLTFKVENQSEGGDYADFSFDVQNTALAPD